MLKQGSKLIELSLQSASKDLIIAQLDYVIDHISKHFAYEEMIIQKLGYPEAMSHAIIHKSMLEQALQLKEEYLQNHLKPNAFFSFIVDDIIAAHMLKEDVLFFSYILKS